MPFKALLRRQKSSEKREKPSASAIGLASALRASETSFATLTSLIMPRNHLAGPIPAVLGSLVHLRCIELGCNQLEGPIPACVGELKRLELLDVRDNCLSGAVPRSLGNCSQLCYLDASGNFGLSGVLPQSVLRLRHLRVADFTGCTVADQIDQIGEVCTRGSSTCRIFGLDDGQRRERNQRAAWQRISGNVRGAQSEHIKPAV
eukprot:g7298.t1